MVMALIGSTAYLVFIWTVLILWGLTITVLALGGLFTRRWMLVAAACGIAAAGILLSHAILYEISD
jgi:hypothetical protein